MSSETFNFNQFVKDSISSLTNPKEYFATMKVDGGLGVPVIKALIYGSISGVISFIWSLLHIGGVVGGIFGGAVGIMLLVWAIVGALIGLFLGAVITLIVSAICSGSTDYEANARVTASLMVIMPISAVFGFLSGTVNSIVGLAINFYSLYMLYHAIIGSLKGKESAAKILGLILGGLLLIIMLVGFGAKKKASKFLDGYGVDMEKAVEDYGKEMEKGLKGLAKEFEEAAEEMEKEAEEAEEE